MAADANLTALLEAYQLAEPNRYRGGIVALTGFQYQAWTYLADFAQALVSKNLLRGGQEFTEAFEALSDYTRASEGATVCVQVKHHLDQRKMSDAAAEFASIDRFLSSHNEGRLRLGIVYEIVARTGDPSLNWAQVELPAEFRAREPDLVSRFDELRRAGRLRAPRFEPDPRWRFVATVFGHVTDPFEFARRSFELCFQRTATADSASYVRNTIAENYAANVQRRQVFSQSLSSGDFESDSQDRGTSIARTPSLLDIRRGRFMSRPHQVTEVLETLDDVFASSRGWDDPAVPVLWIDGQSGSGKSVLLLQLMRHLVVERKASVIWLTRTEELGGIVSQLVASSEGLEPDFLFVDDIYDPQARDDLDLPRMTRQIVHSSLKNWPVVVTCGPSEFRQEFERDSNAEGFRIVPWHLRSLVQSETASLRVWFENRTGTVPDLGPAQAAEQALMISVMFEMTHGDLRPFAFRFRSRLAEERLESVLIAALALNRLYIGFPRNWLSIEDEAKIENINQDGDFLFLSLEGAERGFLRLAHPHLSDAIYRSLLPEAAPRTFAQHLITAFAKALESHLATAVRLLRAIASNPPRMNIIDPDELVRGLCIAWNRSDRSRIHPILAAEMWVNWTRLATRLPGVAALLGTNPLDQSIEALRVDHPNWPSLWSQLSKSAPGDLRIEGLARRWLAEHFTDADWSFVWRIVTEQVLRRSAVMDAAKESANAFLEMGWRWLQASLHQTGWSRVWEQLMIAQAIAEHPVDINTLVGQGAHWCSANPNARDWNFVWERLATTADNCALDISRDEIYQSGLQWLKEHFDHQGWPFVWEHFAESRALPAGVARKELVQLAHDWKADRPRDPSWPYIAMRLTKSELGETKDSDFEGFVVWIEEHRDHPKWAGIWVNLFEFHKHLLNHDQRRRLFVSACSWLAEDDEREKAVQVTNRLISNLSTFKGNTDGMWLVRKAGEVLSRSIEQDDAVWADAWLQAFGYLRGLPATDAGDLSDILRKLGYRWLAVPGHSRLGGWPAIFKVLLRTGLGRETWARDLAFTSVCDGSVADSRRAVDLVVRLLPEEIGLPGPSDELIRWLDEWFTRQSAGSSKSGLRHGRIVFAEAAIEGETRGFSKWLSLDRSATRALTASMQVFRLFLRTLKSPL